MAKMTVYHGGYISVENPQVRIGRNTKDFGTGFYCTVIKEQAQRWAKRYDTKVVSIYEVKDKEIERLLALNKELRNEMKVQKARNIKNREYVYEPDLSEWTTRKRYIDADLEANGYVFDQDKKRNCVEVEYPVVGMPNQTGRGYVD